MTIKGFWKEVNNRVNLADYRTPFQEYATKFHRENGRCLTVGVDLFQWISQLSKSTDVPLGGSLDGFEKIVVRGILSKIRSLRESFVNVVLIFDGKIKPGKHEENNSTEIFEDVYLVLQNQVKNNEYIMNTEVVKQIITALKTENMDYHFAVGDAEIELARLNNAGVIDAIISNDGDSLAYGAKILLRNYSGCLDDIPFARIKGRKSLGTTNSRTMYVTVIDDKVLNQLNLNTMKIMFISLVQGDDYSSGILNIGIKKAWNLATKRCGNWDPVTELRRIYVDNDVIKYIQGHLPYSYVERKQLLEKYIINLDTYIQKHSKELFNQKFNQNLSSLNDSIIAHHFYPQLAPLLYDTIGFQINIINETGKLYPTTVLPFMPQPLSIKKIYDAEILIKRGNDSCGEALSEKFTNFSSNSTSITSNRNPWDWFKPIKFGSVLSHCMQVAPFDKFLVDFSKSYLWITIVNMHNFGFTFDDIFIKKENKGYYQVQYKPRLIFKKFLNLSDNNMDENGKIIPENLATMLIPDYMFDKEPNGRKLLQHFKNGKVATKTRTPRKNKSPTQKTTLDFLSKSPKSPFRIRLIPNNLLLSNATKTEMTNKRDIDNDAIVESSPKKKVKISSKSNPSLVGGNVGIFAEPLLEDAEVSKVLQEDNTDSFLDDEFDMFMKGHKQDDSQAHDSSIMIIENPVLTENKISQNTWSRKFEALKKKEKGRTTVVRGPSLTDTMTKLPEIPKEPCIEIGDLDNKENDGQSPESDTSYEFSSLDIPDSDPVPLKRKAFNSDENILNVNLIQELEIANEQEAGNIKNVKMPALPETLTSMQEPIATNINRINKGENAKETDISYEFSSFDFSDIGISVNKPQLDTGNTKKVRKQEIANVSTDQLINDNNKFTTNEIGGTIVGSTCIDGNNHPNTKWGRNNQDDHRPQIQNDLSDNETIRGDLHTPVQNEANGETFAMSLTELIRAVASSPKSQQEYDIEVDSDDIYTKEEHNAIIVPDGYDGSGLVLVENTDDENIWVLK